MPAGQGNDSDECYDSSSDGHYYKEKRVAKEAHEMRDDIFAMFREKNIWSWDEVIARHRDQQEAPLKRQLVEMCDKVPGSGQGGNAEYVLKSTFKM